MNSVSKYKEFCKIEKNIPIFSQPWWLDAVCGSENWDVVLIEQDNFIIATLPYYKSKKYFFDIINMPQLTQFLGVYIKYPEEQRYEKRISYEKEILNNIINKLPKFDFFLQNFNYSFTNWLAFYWRNFKQTTKYTYVIEDLNDLEKVYSCFSHAKKKNIKKAEKIVRVKFDLSAYDFYQNHKMTLAKQGEKISYNYEVFSKIYNSSYKYNSGRTIYAVDVHGNIHAALFVIWDANSAYDLISTIDPDFRKSGAATLLVKHIIEYVSDKTCKFDFEGSMIESVENSFRQFGAIQKPYFQISKINSRILKIKRAIKEIIN